LFADDSSTTPAAPAAPAPAAAATAKEEKVRKLLKAQGQEAAAKVAFDKMLDTFKKLPGLPPGFLEKFREKASVKEMVDISVPIYAKHLDDATIDAVIAFYETPEGRKLAAAFPALQSEAMDAASVWGQKKAMEVMKELTDGKK
jgi:hypothetical protein